MSSGISNCTDEVADLLDAFGKNLVFIETVGVGQSELEIAEKAHTVVVILVPESGDGVQAMKAGLMEIGDIFVMNKSDHPDAIGAARVLEETLRIKEAASGAWMPPVVLASALKGEGIVNLSLRITNSPVSLLFPLNVLPFYPGVQNVAVTGTVVSRKGGGAGQKGVKP